MSDLKDQVFAVLKGKPLGDLTQRKVRQLLAESQGLQESDLDAQKEQIKQYVQEYVKLHTPPEEEEEEESEGESKPAPKRKKEEESKKGGRKKAKKEESEDEEEEESASDEEPKKKGKKAKKGDDEPEKPKQPPITTRSGKQPPKGVKADQSSAMTGRHFEKNAENVKLSVFGNQVEGPPRTFTSKNRGWYAGGKIEVPVGKKTYWAQMSMNITIIGSREWDD